MAEEKRPQLRIDPQQFAQEVANEIAADLRKSSGGTAPQEQSEEQ